MVDADDRADRYEINGYEVIEKVVRPGNESSGRLNMPLSWVGKRVKVVRIDP
jgi:putative transposon-encoded protein